MSVTVSRQQRLRRLLAARLYAIRPEAEPADTERLVAAWLRAGVPLVQLRQKRLPRGRLLDLACALATACRAAGALLIVNDHVDVALLGGADGAHVGPDDLTVAAARAVAGPEVLLGASASSPEAAREAERDGADYVGCGPAYATPLKPEKRVIGPAGVAAVRAAVAIPVFAIGGIERPRLAELRAAGLTRVCAIRALSDAADPEAEARAWLDELQP